MRDPLKSIERKAILLLHVANHIIANAGYVHSNTTDTRTLIMQLKRKLSKTAFKVWRGFENGSVLD